MKEQAFGQVLKLPNGAHFRKCALQVNPYAYVVDNPKKDYAPPDEATHNLNLVGALKRARVTVAAVTDHWAFERGRSLESALRDAGIAVLRGFEARSSEGVHLLCIFSPETTDAKLAHARSKMLESAYEPGQNPTSNLRVLQLLEVIASNGGVAIAAHATHRQGGLLETLSGTARINCWKSNALLCVAIPGRPDECPESFRQILANKDPEYRRENPVAFINAADVSSPQDAEKPGASTWVKMSEVSAAALRLAFLDHESRIRLNSEEAPKGHATIEAAFWEGHFMEGVAVHFNENLNVLIGSRGAGKSTVVESIRFALGLDPLGKAAKENHDGIVKDVLRPGTKVSLLVQSIHPSPAEYVIERVVGRAPAVRNAKTGDVLALNPLDVMPGTNVFGQHEISELAHDKAMLTRILERFQTADPHAAPRQKEVAHRLEKNRSQLLAVRRDIAVLHERLAELPGLEELNRRFEASGLRDKLKEKTLLMKEERVLNTARQRVESLRTARQQLEEQLPLDIAFISDAALGDLPGKTILAGLRPVLDAAEASTRDALERLEQALKAADAAVETVAAQWNVRKAGVEQAYEQTLRTLQAGKVDGAGFIQLQKQIDELRPLRERLARLERDVEALTDERRNLLAELENGHAAEIRALQSAAKKVSRKLEPHARVRLSADANRDALDAVFAPVKGKRTPNLDRLKTREDLSARDLADVCRKGAAALADRFGLTPQQAQWLVDLGEEGFLKLEELQFSPHTELELNVTAGSEVDTYKPLEALSTGQKATAVLLLLLLDTEAPLIVDQPEDDLDNRFIMDGVVTRMRDMKRKRQFIFATHNANIPVLGDAELILGLTPRGEASDGRAEIKREHMGSIDVDSVRHLVTGILEGGQRAFELRGRKYNLPATGGTP